MKKYQQPEVELTPEDPTKEQRWRHPAYALIGASRVSGTGREGRGAVLFGSDFEHRDYITLHISRAQLDRGLAQDWYHGLSEIIEVAMSEAQWATFVSTLNMGQGVPCTLQHVNHARVPQIPQPPARRQQFKQEMADYLKEAEAALKHLRGCIEKKAGKKEMQGAIWRMENALTPNLGFLADQFGEHVENVTEAAKIEVSAYITGVVQRAGIKSLGGEKPPISLPEEKK